MALSDKVLESVFDFNATDLRYAGGWAELYARGAAKIFGGKPEDWYDAADLFVNQTGKFHNRGTQDNHPKWKELIKKYKQEIESGKWKKTKIGEAFGPEWTKVSSDLGPSQLAKALMHIASKIENSKLPDKDAVKRDLEQILASLQSFNH